MHIGYIMYNALAPVHVVCPLLCHWRHPCWVLACGNGSCAVLSAILSLGGTILMEIREELCPSATGGAACSLQCAIYFSARLSTPADFDAPMLSQEQ